jgi:hypothetical protein
MNLGSAGLAARATSQRTARAEEASEKAQISFVLNTD